MWVKQDKWFYWSGEPLLLRYEQEMSCCWSAKSGGESSAAQEVTGIWSETAGLTWTGCFLFSRTSLSGLKPETVKEPCSSFRSGRSLMIDHSLFVFIFLWPLLPPVLWTSASSASVHDSWILQNSRSICASGSFYLQTCITWFWIVVYFFLLFIS